MPRTVGDLNAGQLFKGRKQQHLALLGGQPLDAGEHVGVMLRRRGHLFGRKPGGGQHSRQFVYVVGLRAGLGAALAVEHDVPNDANEPDAVVAHLTKRVAMAQHAQKCLLHGIFGVGGIAQDGISHAIERAGILVNQRRKRSVFRAQAGFIVHRAIGNLHPTCVNGLAGAHQSPDAGSGENAQASALPSQPLVDIGGDLGRAAGPVREAAMRPTCAASFCSAICPAAPSLSVSRTLAQSTRAWSSLPFGGIQIGKVELRHAG